MNYEVRMLPIKTILQDTEWNCRGPIRPIDVVDLMKDIQQHGLMTPVTVIPWDKNGYPWKLVAGYRRTKACQQLNMDHVPAFINTDLTDTQARILNLRENLHRVDLNIMQEANAIKPLRVKDGLSEKAIAQEFGKSLTWVKVRLMLLELEPDIQAVAASGILTQEQIKKIHGSSKEQRYELVRKIKEKTFRLDDVKVTKPIPKHKRNQKGPPDYAMIQSVLERIYDITGATFVTRTLAWASGEVTYDDYRSQIIEYLTGEGFDPNSYQD